MDPVRFALIQYGNYRDALRAKREGRPASFRMQYYTMDTYEGLLGDGRMLVVNLDTEPFEVVDGQYTLVGDRFDPRSSGLRYHRDARRAGRRVVDIVSRFDATHVAVTTPGWPTLSVGRWALAHRRFLLPLFADYVASGGLAHWLRNRGLRRLLNDPAVPVVANHHFAASRSLVGAGVAAHKVVPWDYPVQRDTDRPRDRTLSSDRPLRLLYAGALIRAKGVGDLLEAAAILARRRRRIDLTICGNGEDADALRAQAAALDLHDERARFLGTVANSEVRRMMHEADLVVVPSRPSYAEGLAGVISEAFEVGTPLLVSDHPAFAVRDGLGCRRFRAGDPASLAGLIDGLLDDPARHRALVDTLEAGRQLLACPVTFAQVYQEWMRWTLTGEPMACLQHSVAELGEPLTPAAARRRRAPESAA